MPIKKMGDEWEVNGKTYDTEEKAEAAYKALIALKLGVEEPEVSKPKKKKKSKSKDDEDED
jgi:hypothetical protein